MKYRILSHTADLRLEVFGKNIGELFINAAIAIGDILLGKSQIAKHKLQDKRCGLLESLKLEALNQNALLVDFLNAILAKSEINLAIYKVGQIKVDGNTLTAKIQGCRVDSFKEDIKAVTYHGVEIKKQGEVWTTQLVLDI